MDVQPGEMQDRICALETRLLVLEAKIKADGRRAASCRSQKPPAPSHSRGVVPLNELLDQGEIWVSKDGDGNYITHRLEDMTSPHLVNLQSWLLSKAKRIHSAELLSLYSAGHILSGEAALDSIDGEIGRLESQDPKDWMKSQELYEAISSLLARRLEDAGPG